MSLNRFSVTYNGRHKAEDGDWVLYKDAQLAILKAGSADGEDNRDSIIAELKSKVSTLENQLESSKTSVQNHQQQAILLNEELVQRDTIITDLNLAMLDR